VKRFDCLFLRDARLLTEVLSPTDPCVDVIITSPPYWNLKDYGAPNQIGHGQSKDKYLVDMEKVLRDCLLVTRPTGSLWLVVDTYREGREVQLLPFELAEHVRQVGWRLRDLIVWDKQHSVPWQAGGQLRNISEFILFMTKSDNYKYHVDRIKTLDELSKWWVDFPERFNPKGKTPTNIWSIPMRPRGSWRKPSKLDHYCSFPTALVARIIELTTDPGDLVMDPFAGSGVVLAQAAAMGRHYIGFEINEEYIQMFEETVKDEVAAEWEEMKAWRESQTGAKVDFEQTIMKLRALKYARQVTRPFLEAVNTEQQAQVQAVLCIASIPDEYQRGHPFDVEVLIVVDQSLPEFKIALKKARGRAARPPLTQYGIRSDMQITTYSDLKRQSKFVDQKLYLYSKYKPRKYIASDSLRNWFEEGRLKELAEDQKVPMLANVAVDVAWVLEKE
jgi:DNA modification methylase